MLFRQAVLVLFLGCLSFVSQAQNDSSPNLSTYFKTIPVLEDDMPDWVNLMYTENPSVWEVDQLYNTYYRNNPFVKTTHTQNYKFWRKLLNENHLINDKGFIKVVTVQDIKETERLGQQIYKAAQNGQRMSNWTPVGPMTTKADNGQPEVSWQTNVYTFEQSLSNPNKLYAGSETGAIFTSNDKGLNWINIGTNISDGAIQSISVDPTNDQIAYFGTQHNIWKTTDGGATLNSVYFQNNIQTRDFYINSNNTDIVLAATNIGIYRSTNAGMTWTQLYTSDGWDLEAKPGSPNTVYLLMSNTTDQMIKFYKSTNAGATFTEYNNGWYTGNTNGIDNSNSGARMAVTPADPNRVYVVLLGNDDSYAVDNNMLGVYKSMDSGVTWTLPVGEVGGPYDANHICLSSFNPTSVGYDQGYYNLGIAASATNADEILVGCLNLFKSDDGAASYTQWGGYGGGPGWQHPDIQEIEINGSDVWVASDGGLNYYSADFSSHESRINGINGSSYWGFDSGWNVDILVGGRYHNGNGAYVETYNDGQFLRLGGAESPTGYVNKGENLKVWHSDIGGDIVPSDINDPISGISNLALYPNESYFNENKSDLKTYPNCYNHFLLGKDNTLWKSENSGASFFMLHTFGGSSDPLVNIEISRSNPDVIYVVQKVSGSTLLWKTNDGGLNWTSTTVPGAVGGGMFITLSPTDENTIWAAHSKNGNTNKVLISRDGGISWTDLTTNTLNGLYPEDILVQGGTNEGVYLSTHLGMYYRNQSHTDWQLYNTGLPANFAVMEMRPFYRDSKLRAASNRGIWEVEFFETSTPIAQPTVDKLYSTCPLDTFYFEDFSMLDHTGATWNWTFSPTPLFVDNVNKRNPKVVFGTEGMFSFSLIITNPNGSDSKSYTDLIEITGNECLVDTIPGGAMQCISSGDYAQLPDLEIGLSNTFTSMAWVKPNGIQDDYTGIVFNDGDSAGLNFRGGNNTLGYHWPNGAWWWDSGLVVPADEWSHVAIVTDPTGVTLYLNGVASKHSFAAGQANLSTMKIGSYKGWSSRNYDGLIDEVAIWNRALTQDEIREHRHLTHYLVQDPTIVAYYQFNETNSIIYDKIANKHTAFSGNANRVNSTAPVGGGTVKRLNITTNGSYDFSPTGVQMDFSTGAIPIGEVVAFQLNVAPDERPAFPTIPKEGYYIINNYGTNTTFSELNSIEFGNTPITNVETQNFTNLSLQRRADNADGMTWLAAQDIADVATSGTMGSVTFNNGNSVTTSGQYIIHKDNCPDILYVNVQPIDGDTLQANLIIESNGTEITGSNIVFHAGECISLNAGFEVENGAEFLANIENCSTTATLVENDHSKKSGILNTVSSQKTDQNYTLHYTIAQQGKYTLYLQSLSSPHQVVLYKDQALNAGQQQAILQQEQFKKGLYLMVLEMDGELLDQELVRF